MLDQKNSAGAHPQTFDANVIRRIALGDTLHRSARRMGARTAVIDHGVHTSYAELDALSSQCAHWLLASGLQPGDKVALLGGNSTQFLVAVYGILKAGLVWVPVNTMLGVADVRHILEHAEVKQVIMDDVLYAQPPLQGLVRALELPVILMEHERHNADHRPTLWQVLQGQPESLPQVIVHDEDLALIMYTSGTTGRQKGVMHSHLSVQSALMSSIAESGIRYDSVLSCILPLFHCGQFTSAGAALLAGAALVVQRGFDAGAVLQAIEEHRISDLFCLPLMYAALLNHPRYAECDLSSLRKCTYAMAPMPQPLLERLIQEFCPYFSLGSGQTEMFPPTTIFRSDQQLQRFGNYWGTATLVNDMAIMDDEGRLLEPGQVGEIVHRGPNMMLGYYKDPQATAHARRFGWHHTGDLGCFDADGQLLFLDRIKDIIKTGGENVPSLKVEEVLLRHAAVANAAVVGLPHPHWYEAITAFVMLKPGAACEVDALLQHCREHLGGFEVPKHIQVVDAFPMTPTGKIQKHVLRTAHSEHFTVALERTARD